ncbi:MAG: Lrp/AsnC ligand binding domain-containing protein [Sphingomonadales bacterium]|nr:Lrp/AsnC ligand binding domain-containing protein [Sphingomonadales bacterium]
MSRRPQPSNSAILPQCLFRVGLDSQSDEALSAFEEALRARQSFGATSCRGREDYLLTVAARSIEDYGRIHRQKLRHFRASPGYETAFALREIVNRSVPPQIFADLLG